jgi:hypothetical protein
MTSIQRYDAWPQEWPFEDEHGDLVTYEDHRKIVEELEGKLAKAREEGFWAGRSCGGAKKEIDAALADLSKERSDEKGQDDE